MGTPKDYSFRSACFTGILLLLSLVFLLPFPGSSDGGCGFSKWFFLITTLLAYAALYYLPAHAALWIARLLRLPRLQHLLTYLSAFLAASTSAVLFLDYSLLRQFGFHINGLVINLIITPGGFASMGLGLSTLLPAILGLLLLYALYFSLAYFCLHAKTALAVGKRLYRPLPHYGMITLLLFCLLGSLLSCGLADFYSHQSILTNLEIYPVTFTMRMRKFLRRIGCTEPPHATAHVLSTGEKVHYPAKPIRRAAEYKKYNFIWLVAESLRADLFSEEIMPNTWAFSREATRFQQHYSGGNGTRPGVFSLFYGLYALTWDNFLNNKQPPLLFQWLQEDNYQFLCQTSTDFTYPEFDKTVFVSIPGENMLQHKKGNPCQRDAKLLDTMLEFLEKRDASRPFFLFGFLESTHAPYSFPPEAAIRKNYPKSINYNTVSAKDAPALYARYANAAHYLDSQLNKIYDYLQKHPDLAENTILILAGDHGEEFFEKGRLGHNSTFSEEQIRPLFLMKVPGRQPQSIAHITQHTDVIATLAPLLGVQNPPEDFCVGQDIYSPRYNRSHYLVCGWEIACFLNERYKTILPVGAKGGLGQNKVTRRDDSPCSEEEEENFFENHASQILQVQQDLSRFSNR